MINFDRIRWKNLLSTGNDFIEVVFNKAKTSLIVGTNGAGKSTILDAIMFCLYNRPFRRVNKGQLINSITGKNLLVEIEFDKGGFHWMVRRGSKPNIFEIIKDGVLVDQNSENRDYQQYLETVLGMNQKAFSQIVILGAASFIPFMQLTVPARREVIEDLLDIQVFSEMNVLLKTRVSRNNYLLNEIGNAVEIAKTKIEMTEEFNRKQLEGKEDIIEDKQTKIEELSDAALDVIKKLEAAQTNLDSFTSTLVKVDETKKRKMEDELLTIRQEKAALGKVVHFLESHDECPTCKQVIDETFKLGNKQSYDKHVAKSLPHETDLKQMIEELAKQQNDSFEVQKNIKHVEAEIIEFNREVVWYQKQVESLMAEIDQLQQSNKKEITDTTNMKEQFEKMQSELDGIQRQSEVLSSAGLLLKDGGIKSVIIKQYVPIINELINRYLSSMDFFVDFQINESFEETIKSRFRDEFSYESFSEGEKMRIDLAVLFAWRTVAKMRNSASTNLLIFDEVLDSSLDQYGIDEFLRIIQSLTEQENIFIISHRGDAIGDKFDRVLKFNKVKSFTQLSEAA